MRIAIDGTEYALTDVSKATLAELLILERETAQLGRSLSLGAIEDMEATLASVACDEHAGKSDPKCLACANERGRHPDALWMMGAMVWLAKRRAGERVSFLDAIDFDLGAVAWLADPDDIVPEESDPTPARAGSVPGGKTAKRARDTSR